MRRVKTISCRENLRHQGPGKDLKMFWTKTTVCDEGKSELREVGIDRSYRVFFRQ